MLLRLRTVSYIYAILLAVAGLLFYPPQNAYADECVVSAADGSAGEEGSLSALVHAVIEAGSCLTNDATVREQYKDRLAMAQDFHLIRWRQSMDIHVAELPALQGHDGRPLILRAEPGIQVRLIGADAGGPLVMEGSGGIVIVDGVTLTDFSGTAISVRSDGNSLIRTRVVHSGTVQLPAIVITGRRTWLQEMEIADNRGIGVQAQEKGAAGDCGGEVSQTAGDRTTIVKSTIRNNAGDGALIDAYHAVLMDNQIHENASHGVIVRAESAMSRCLTAAGKPVPDTAWHTALLQRNLFWENGGPVGDAIHVPVHPLMPPVDLIVVSPPTTALLTLIGNVSRVNTPDSPWRDGGIDFGALRVEIYLADNAESGEGRTYLTSVATINPITRQFTVELPAPKTNAVFTATVIDTENGNTSPFAAPLDVAQRMDWDSDGITNAEEDLNHDGLVDTGETDPRLADTDGDGVNDGAERAKHLDPRNADSDGDCLPDGLELGIDQAHLPLWKPATGSVLLRPRVTWADACADASRKHSVLTLANAIPADAAQPTTIDNIVALYDVDPSTTTDPLNPDSDHDNLLDGAEDWNWDGKRTEKQSSVTRIPSPVTAEKAAALLVGGVTEDGRRKTDDVVALETDPTNPDSDGDGLLDGEEGDRNHNSLLDPAESDPLKKDTDGDGADDGAEFRKLGTLPNQCDSDGDGLGDGLENGVVNPRAANKACLGLQTVGSNFASIGALNPLNTDADHDGLPDGAEDVNHNGWLDPRETDPTAADTDLDGIGDYVEATGDLDRDGIADFELAKISNGPKCAPPPTMNDLDCDEQPNAQDEDADNDGCSDKEEGLDPRGDVNGIPAAYNAKINACGATKTPSNGGGAAPTPAATPTPVTTTPAAALSEKAMKGGGGCSLVFTEDY